MMKHEFEELTGAKTSDETFAKANELYMALPNVDKADFCAAWAFDIAAIEAGLSASENAILEPVWQYVSDYNAGKRALAKAGCSVELPAIHSTLHAKAAEAAFRERLGNMRALQAALKGCTNETEAAKLAKVVFSTMC